MIYQGSKARLIKDILPYIQNCIDSNKVNLYIEPFVGGANVIQHIKRATKIGLDTNKYLIALLKYCQNNPDLTDAFEDCPFELYKEVRDSYNKGDDRYEDWQKGLVGFCASYGGRFFDGGYGRDKTGKRNIYIRKESSTLKMRLKTLWECLSQCRTTLLLTAMPKRLLLLSSTLTHLMLVRNNTRITSGTTSFIVGLENSQNTISFSFQNIKCQVPSAKCQVPSAKCQVPSAKCQVPSAKCQVPSDFLSMWTKKRKVMQKSDRASAELFSEHLFTHKDGLYYKWYHEEGYKL